MKKKKEKKTLTVGALLLVGVLTAGVCCTGYASRGENGKWFTNANILSWHWKDKQGDDGKGENKPDDGENNDDNKHKDGFSGVFDEQGNALYSGIEYQTLSEIAYSIPTAQSISADDGITIVATLLPEYTTDTEVDWNVSFVDDQSEWAQDKNVSDYVTVTPVVNLSTNAVLRCIAPFGEQMIVTASVHNRPEVSKSITVDYLSSFNKDQDVNYYVSKGQTVRGDFTVGNPLHYVGVYSYFDVSYGVGTVKPQAQIVSTKLGLSEEFCWKIIQQAGNRLPCPSGSCFGYTEPVAISSHPFGDYNTSMPMALFKDWEGYNDETSYQALRTAVVKACNTFTSSNIYFVCEVNFVYGNYNLFGRSIEYTTNYQSQGGITRLDLSSWSTPATDIELDQGNQIFGKD